MGSEGRRLLSLGQVPYDHGSVQNQTPLFYAFLEDLIKQSPPPSAISNAPIQIK